MSKALAKSSNMMSVTSLTVNLSHRQIKTCSTVKKNEELTPQIMKYEHRKMGVCAFSVSFLFTV
jgi:hypothetical protein